MTTKPRIAAILTEYRPNSHADVIVTKLLEGIPTDRGVRTPRVEIVSMYVDQFPDNDMSRAIADKHGVPIYPSIASALTLGGPTTEQTELAVDGVLLIGEHGDYAWNEKGQHLYPRKYFMEQICGVFATSGRAVPVFNDKHLAYNWHDARWMVDRAAALGAGLMAGSSLPFCWRSPWLEHEVGVNLQEAVALGYGGLDSYGFHTLETLQCMVERRNGGETGVAAVTCLEGERVWAAADWWIDLADAACCATPAGAAVQVPDAIERLQSVFTAPALFLLEYRDGFRGAILMQQEWRNSFQTFAYAARLDDQIAATEFHLQSGPPHAHFSYLSLNIEEMFLSGQPTVPVERTLLTTGVLEAALTSRYDGHVRVETPHLAVSYTPAPTVPWRAEGTRPGGATRQAT